MSQIPQNQLPLSLMPNLQNINFPQTQILATEIPINLIQEEKILTQILYLSNLIQNNDLINLSIFLQENKLTKQTLQTGILLILKKYEKNNLIYQMINLLLNSGADVNSPISYYNKINIDEKDNITLLMFAIIFNDIDLIKIILNNPFIDINKIDSKNRNAIFYSVIYDNNDNNQIISLLIKNQANINSFAKIEVLNQNYEIHSIFTLACYKGLINIVKVLLENNVNVNFQTKPKEDTGLHLAVQFRHYEIIKILLNSNLVYVDQINKYGKKPFDIAVEKGFNDIIELFKYYYNERNILLNNKNQINNTSILMNNNMFINNNNNLSNNTITIENTVYSSDIEDYIEEEKDKSFSNLSEIIHNSQINNLSQSQNLSSISLSQSTNLYSFNSNNIKKNNKTKNYFLPKNIKELNKKLFTNIVKKNEIKNNNLKIPVEFITNNEINNNIYINNNFFSPIEESKKLNNFIKISNSPTLTIDLTDKSFEKELELLTLKNILKEKEEIIQKYQNQLNENEKTIKELSLTFSKKEKILSDINLQKEEFKNQIEELKARKNELISKIPNNETNISKKNLPIKEYRENKFQSSMYNDIIKILQKDLIDYKNYIEGKMIKKKFIIEQLIANIRMTVNECFQDLEVKIYGSYATGLHLPWSDLDVVLINKHNIIVQPENILKKLFLIFKEKKWIYSIKYIETPIPSLKIISNNDYEGIYLDLSIQDEKYHVLECVSLVKSYLKEYKSLEPIILALKTILKNANLNNQNLGGLSSYGLILMVVSYIQNMKENNILNENEENSLGKIFYGFLKHYGINFDYNKYVILTYPINDTSNNLIIDKDNHINFDGNHELIIVDPLNNQNNVALNTYQFMNLKMAFMIAFMVCKEDCECGCHYGKAFYEHSISHVEHCILKRMFNSVKRFSENK